LNASLPEGDLEKEGVELSIDAFNLSLFSGKISGTLNIEIPLGLMLHPVREERLKELANSNFLGVNTGGCSLCFDENSITLFLKSSTTPFTTPQENWEWMHRILSVSQEWIKALSLWDEFVPLSQSFLPDIKPKARA
jgi:hypothetical protein